MERPLVSRLAGLAGLVALSACGPLDALTGSDRDGLQVAFEDRAAPEAFRREGEARRSDSDVPGLWAIVADLPRAERARIRIQRSRRQVEVALFAAQAGTPASDIRLSPEAADVLGMEEGPVAVEVIALRREPLLNLPSNGF